MPPAFYHVLHVAGIIGVFFSLGGVIFHVSSGGTRDTAWRRGAAILHGVGLLLIFVSGFGLLAKLGIPFNTGWVYAKLAIWLLLGVALAIPYRKPEWSKALFFVIPLIGVIAAYLANYKPF